MGQLSLRSRVLQVVSFTPAPACFTSGLPKNSDIGRVLTTNRNVVQGKGFRQALHIVGAQHF